MKCIAIDDEPLALSIIDNYCSRLENTQLQTFTNPLLGVKAIKEQKPDIVFLDIEMNDYSGLELARELPDNSLLIFSTAHASYAIDGYELNAIDFLHKPFSFDRFCSAIERAKQILSMRQRLENKEKIQNNIITIKVEYQNVSINSSDIFYVEASDNYIKINTKDRNTVLTKMSIKGFMELLPPDGFLRIHRSFVVNKAVITSFSKQQVRLRDRDSVSLPVGRNYAERLFVEMKDVINHP